jgi:catechol 2,3-dioxygenase-like lactoylglutathione lyase family enzyme
MKLNAFVLFVKDIKKSKSFYIKALQQRILYDFGTNVQFESGLTIWEMNSEHIIVQKLKQNFDSNEIEVYFEDDDLELFADKLRANGVEFLHDIHEESWGQRTIRFFDPDHHLIEVGEQMPVFVKRLFDSGLSREQISQKTSIPLAQLDLILS